MVFAAAEASLIQTVHLAEPKAIPIEGSSKLLDEWQRNWL